MLVCKFGGTSVGTKEALSSLASIIKNPEHEGRVKVIVVSALSGITDGLIKTARIAQESSGGASAGEHVAKLIAEMKKRHLDLCAAFLKNEERKEAAKEIEQSFAELSRMMDGIAILREI